MYLIFFIFLESCSVFSSFAAPLPSSSEIPHGKNASGGCPLNIDVLRKLSAHTESFAFTDVATECQNLLQAIRILRAEYLRSSGKFDLPSDASEACWDSFQALVEESIPGFDTRSACGVQTDWISQACMNVTTPSQFESRIPEPKMEDIRHYCNQSLKDGSPCRSCRDRLSRLEEAYFRGPDIGNVSDCTGYPFIYAAALVNRFGPTDLQTVKCLFLLDFTSVPTTTKRHKNMIFVVVMVSSVGLLVMVIGVWVLWRRRNRRQRRSKEFTGPVSGLVMSNHESTSSVIFTLEGMKEATMNFSWQNKIGNGRYGNVYKGILPDGSEVALKRFKNCTAAGDSTFTHEVEVVASVRHVNLVALRGYCTATHPWEGHQRIIVCDLMPNGSLYDHLFGSGMEKLSWPIRRNIALGTARGLAYLHYGVQPAIIHRDVKASNILLDENFEPKLADFGLAKFHPEGLTHMSTKVAGTLGYVAPEYALYGQLTEGSDVYSFGVVLLELLSGNRALTSGENGETSLLADWAWSLVREERGLDVVERGMPGLGSPEEMEKYVLIAVLASHPQPYARPAMDQIVKILETDLPVPSIPDRPASPLAEINYVHPCYMSNSVNSLSFSSSSSHNLFMENRKQEGTSE